MSFDKLIAKVTQAENAMEANERRVGADVRQLRDSWKAMWTPGRIVLAGLVSGYLAGRAEPCGAGHRGAGRPPDLGPCGPRRRPAPDHRA